VHVSEHVGSVESVVIGMQAYARRVRMRTCGPNSGMHVRGCVRMQSWLLMRMRCAGPVGAVG
jgi:hypothetical protein